MSYASKTRNPAGNRAPALIAYYVPDREKAPWARIGAAWEHKDGDGLTLELELVPTSGGRIVLRSPKDKREGPSQAFNGN